LSEKAFWLLGQKLKLKSSLRFCRISGGVEIRRKPALLTVNAERKKI
jgi:hypothetical protein